MSKEMLAIDFDSVGTCIYKSGNGIVLYEPTVAAVDDASGGEIKAFGENAKKLIGKTSKTTKIVFPIFDGEVVNEKVASEILSGFLKKIEVKNKLFGNTALFSVSCGASSEMIEKYKNVAKRSGLGKIYFAESPFLSALGQRIPLNDSAPCFVIDMAGGVTNIAVLSLDGIIAGVSVNFGGNKITTDIIDYLAEKFSLQIGLLTAERIKKEIGSLDEYDALSTIVNGRDIITGNPVSMTVRACDVIQPIKKYFDKIGEIALSILKKLPPEVSAEIRHSGLYISGATAEIYDLANYYKRKFMMNVNIPSNPAMSVALGGGIALGNPDLLKSVTLKTK